jgi:hypothetical protein
MTCDLVSRCHYLHHRLSLDDRSPRLPVAIDLQLVGVGLRYHFVVDGSKSNEDAYFQMPHQNVACLRSWKLDLILSSNETYSLKTCCSKTDCRYLFVVDESFCAFLYSLSDVYCDDLLVHHLIWNKGCLLWDSLTFSSQPSLDVSGSLLLP